MDTKNENHIEIAVEKAGGPVAVARLTGAKNYQTVQQWVASGQVPAEYCLVLEEASGVSRFLLNRKAESIWPEKRAA